MVRVLLPLAEGFEELEAITVIDLLRRAGVEVVSAGLRDGPVRASRGTVVVPDTALDRVSAEDFDMIVLPGGLPGADHLDGDPRIHDLLMRQAGSGRYTAAICAAPRVLANAGLLDGKAATAYPGVVTGDRYPRVTVLDRPVVTDGKVITSRGPGTAMDFALQLIESLVGLDKRNEVETALVR
jgi:4-methyl-5(b-hydroxyethyl)-thiazole monophosphate biosynthesis